MKISVVIPSYNSAKYIAECLDSVLNQSYADIEIICVDDCSSDQTYLILESYRQKHPSITLFRNEKNLGAPYSRNRGLDSSRGNYILFLDADDVLLPGRIGHQVSLIRNSSRKIGFISGAYIRKHSNGEEEKKIPLSDSWQGLLSAELGCTCSNLFLAEALKQVNGWKDGLQGSQESELMFRLLQNGAEVLTDPLPLTRIRSSRQGSISSSNLSNYWINYINLRVDIVDYLVGVGLFTGSLREHSLRAVFDATRILYHYNKEQAVAYHNQLIRGKYFPGISVPATGVYIFFYRLLGFAAAEQLSKYFRFLKLRH